MKKRSPQAIRDAARRIVVSGAATQRQLAEKAGINAPQLSRFLGRTDEKGLAPDRLAALEATVAALTPRDLVIPESHLLRLADKLRDQQLAVFVGAGLSHLAPRRDGGPRRLPLWANLAREVAAQCHVSDPEVYHDPLDLFDAVVFGAGGRPDLERAIRTALDDRDYVPSTAHEALTKLPWQAVLTTNYDSLLQRLLNERPVAEEADYDRLGDRTPPRLFHVHGTLDHPHTLTLTRDDYRMWAEKHPRAWRHLEELLLNKTVLFVGYSLSDPHLDTLLATIRQITRGREKRIYAWMWRITDGQIQLLDKRDHIEAISLGQEGDWAQAFAKLHQAYQRQQAGEPLAEPAAVATNDPFHYDRAQYCQAIESRHGEANVHALYLPGAGYARDDVLLEEIFTEPDLESTEPQRPEVDDESPAATLGQDGTQGDCLRRLRLREKESLDRLPREAPGEPRRRPASERLQSESDLAILGAPGQGKSTLLRHWLLAAARQWRDAPESHPVPVYIRLSDWEAGIAPGDGRLLHYLTETLPKFAEVSSSAVAQWRQGPILWLLDGVDEIRDPHERQRFREEVRTLAGQRPGDRWVVASRPAGYPAGGMGSDWTVTELPALTPPQVVSVLERWSQVLAKKEGLVLDPQQLADALEREAGLRRIRGNALLLTLAVLFYKAHRKLPQDRWEFYEHAERALRDQWVRHRMTGAEAHLPGKYLVELLEALALKGMAEGVVSFSRRTLEAEAEPALHRWGYTGGDLDDELTRLIRAAEDLIGVLVAHGPDRFGFLHLTFQEFYAARALVKRSAEAPRWIAQHWDHPDWEEVWALYALGIGDDSARLDELFAAILANGDRLDQHLFRPYLACLRLAGVGSRPIPTGSVAWEAVEEWTVASLAASGYRFDATLSCLARWEKPAPTPLVDALLQNLHHEQWFVRSAVTRALVPHAANQSVQDTLIKKIRKEHVSVRSAAARALAPHTASPRVRHAVLQGLGDPDVIVRYAVAQSLADYAANRPLQDALLELIGNEDWRVRQAASEALATHATNPTIQDALIQRLGDEDWHVRQAAAQAVHAYAVTPAIRDALLQRLGDDEPNVRRTAAHALAPHAANPPVQGALLQRLGDEDWGVRRTAVDALAPYTANLLLQDALLQRLGDDDSSVRQAAAAAVAPHAATTIIHDALLQRLGDENPDVRRGAARALAPYAANPDLKDGLLQRLGDEDPDVRRAAAEALAPHAALPGLQNALLQRLDKEDWRVRQAAAEALAHHARNPTIQDALLHRLDDENPDVRLAATRGLASHTENSLVQNILCHRLSDEDSLVREAAAEALTPRAANSFVQDALLQRLGDEDSDIRQAAVEALAPYAAAPPVQDALLQRLEDEEWLVREAAAQALAVYAVDPAVQDALVERLGDEDRDVRQTVARVLEQAILAVRFPSRAMDR